jgi:hypothetical protein
MLHVPGVPFPLTLIPSPLPKGRGRMLSTPQLRRSLKSGSAWPFIPLKTAKNLKSVRDLRP